jgi:hypothetical protein
MKCKYYTLICREDGKWSPQFGDYDKSVVRDELDDYANSFGSSHYARKDIMIIATDDDMQATIDAAIAKLNPTCRHCDNPPLAGYNNCLACLEELGGDY